MTETNTPTEPESFQTAPGRRLAWSGLKEYHPEVKNLAEGLERMIWACLTGQPNPKTLILCGTNGIGKTKGARKSIDTIGLNAVYAWSKRRVNRILTTGVYHWSLIAGMTPGDRSTETSWADAVEADVILLDDVGAEVDRYKNGQTTENLRLILELRKNKRTIITTNAVRSQWSDIWDKRVDERLNRGSLIVECPTAPSYHRQTLRP